MRSDVAGNSISQIGQLYIAFYLHLLNLSS
jgi:hypothetical protein